jgi:hypothetical protein
MINFIDLFNAIAKVVRPAHHDYESFTNEEQKFVDSSLDSLDMLMVGYNPYSNMGLSGNFLSGYTYTDPSSVGPFIG